MGKGGGGRGRKAHLVLPAVAAGSLAALRPVGCAVGCERDERSESKRARERKEEEREREREIEIEREREEERTCEKQRERESQTT